MLFHKEKAGSALYGAIAALLSTRWWDENACMLPVEN
jgi:hypothetical protein